MNRGNTELQTHSTLNFTLTPLNLAAVYTRLSLHSTLFELSKWHNSQFNCLVFSLTETLIQLSGNISKSSYVAIMWATSGHCALIDQNSAN